MLLARVPGWDPAKLGAPSDITPAVQRLSDLVDPREDWSASLKRNGKLILYHAASDYQVNGHGMFRLYEQAMKKNDQAAMGRSVRFYVAPNVGHGSYGISATTGEPLPPYVDLITSLADWVEKEIPPPDSVLQTIKDGSPPYTVRVSRPLCRYPNYPRYTGRGDAKQAESYQCTAPASE
jgi:feruloyl esterase